jgi:hypothetical protein
MPKLAITLAIFLYLTGMNTHAEQAGGSGFSVEVDVESVISESVIKASISKVIREGGTSKAFWMFVQLLDNSEVLANVNRGSLCVRGLRDVVRQRSNGENEKDVTLAI